MQAVLCYSEVKPSYRKFHCRLQGVFLRLMPTTTLQVVLASSQTNIWSNSDGLGQTTHSVTSVWILTTYFRFHLKWLATLTRNTTDCKNKDSIFYLRTYVAINQLTAVRLSWCSIPVIHVHIKPFSLKFYENNFRQTLGPFVLVDINEYTV